MPADGLCLATWPAGTVGSKSSVRMPTWRPASEIAWSAAVSSFSLRSGTGTVPGPVATVIFTALPTSIFVPGSGSWVRTVPSGWSADSTPVGVRVSPSASAWALAWVDVSPTNCGTATCSAWLRPPDASWNTKNATSASSTTAAMPASQTIGLVASSSGGAGAAGGGGGVAALVPVEPDVVSTDASGA